MSLAQRKSRQHRKFRLSPRAAFPIAGLTVGGRRRIPKKELASLLGPSNKAQEIISLETSFKGAVLEGTPENIPFEDAANALENYRHRRAKALREMRALKSKAAAEARDGFQPKRSQSLPFANNRTAPTKTL